MPWEWPRLLCGIHLSLVLKSIQWMKNTIIYDSTTDGHLQCSYSKLIMKSATLNILKYALDEHMYACLLGVGWNCWVSGYCAFQLSFRWEGLKVAQFPRLFFFFLITVGENFIFIISINLMIHFKRLPSLLNNQFAVRTALQLLLNMENNHIAIQPYHSCSSGMF